MCFFHDHDAFIPYLDAVLDERQIERLSEIHVGGSCCLNADQEQLRFLSSAVSKIEQMYATSNREIRMCIPWTDVEDDDSDDEDEDDDDDDADPR